MGLQQKKRFGQHLQNGAFTNNLAKAGVTSVRADSEWYASNRSEVAAQKFAESVYDTLDRLSNQPTIGLVDEKRSTSKTKYYSFPIHPKYRVTYRFMNEYLFVVAIRAMQMKGN